MRLRHVCPANFGDIEDLYKLLKERAPNESISHKAMPSLAEHYNFVRSCPYLCWYMLENVHMPEHMFGADLIGAIYLTRNREIGVHIKREYRKLGFAKEAVRTLMALHPGRFLANVNPANTASIKLWESLGFKHIQNTYALEG